MEVTLILEKHIVLVNQIIQDHKVKKRIAHHIATVSIDINKLFTMFCMVMVFMRLRYYAHGFVRVILCLADTEDPFLYSYR